MLDIFLCAVTLNASPVCPTTCDDAVRSSYYGLHLLKTPLPLLAAPVTIE